jgi:hypothetical protein
MFKKMKITEFEDKLIIEYKWFSLLVFKYLFLTLTWGLFLVFITNMMLGNDSKEVIIGLLIVFVHALTMCYLIYYIVALFINKTIITVTKQSITVKHKPLKWKNAKTLQVENIHRIDLKNGFSSYQNDSTCYYDFIVEQSKGRRNIDLLGVKVIANESDALEIEQKIKQFLEIDDYEIVNEFEFRTQPQEIERQQVKFKEKNILNLKISDLKKGYLIDYENQTWEVIFEVQYSWVRGSMDKLFQLRNHKKKTILLYVQQDMGMFNLWLETELSHNELNKQKEIFKKRFAAKQNINSGKTCSSQDTRLKNIKQWHFINKTGKKSLRVLQIQMKDWLGFSGKKVDEFEFENMLIP